MGRKQKGIVEGKGMGAEKVTGRVFITGMGSTETSRTLGRVTGLSQ